MGPKEECKDLQALARVRHTPEHAAEELPVPMPIPHQISTAPQSCFTHLCSQRTSSWLPRDLTHKTTAQTGFYTHRGLDGQASSIRAGVLTPDTPPRSRSQEHGWTRGGGMGR